MVGGRLNGNDRTAVKSIPGLIEARQVGDHLQMAIADANGVAHESIEKSFGRCEQVETTLNDAVLAFLTRQRGDSSFFSGPVTRTPTNTSEGVKA